MTKTLIPGFRFKEGRLLIFTEAEAFVLHPWPELKAVRKKANGQSWTAFTPTFRLLRPKASVQSGVRNLASSDLGPSELASSTLDPELDKRRAFDNFRHALPPEAAAAVERFPGGQWRGLALIKAQRQSLDLLRQNPALGFCLAHCHQLRHCLDDPLALAARLCRSKQWELARWLGFPPTEAAVRLLAKIQPEAVGLPMLKEFREALKDLEVQKLLAHLPAITTGVLSLVGDPHLRAFVTPKLLMEVAESPDEQERARCAHLLLDLHRMQTEMGPERPRRGFLSIEKVREVHREACVAYCRWREAARHRQEVERRRMESEWLRMKFPAPPVPGTPEIVPLLDAVALAEEGRQQANCVRTYAHWVKSGAGYVYRVLHPERATLSIAMGAAGDWHIQQLALARNERVKAETEQFVRAWLKQHSLSI